MRRLFLFAAVGWLAVVLAACGGEENTANLISDTSDEEMETDEKKEDEGDKEKEESEDKKKEEAQEISDTTLETEHYTFVINEVDQLTSAYDDTEVLALEIEFTNHSKDTRTPWLAAATSITAEQETDEGTEVLNGANAHFPEDYKADLVSRGSSGVKSGETVEAVIGYEIPQPGEPVQLVDFSLFNDPTTFERVIETEE